MDTSDCFVDFVFFVVVLGGLFLFGDFFLVCFVTLVMFVCGFCFNVCVLFLVATVLYFRDFLLVPVTIVYSFGYPVMLAPGEMKYRFG